jgi:hypothetical protein
VPDYVHTKVPTLARMHGKRLTTYRRLDFTTNPVQPRVTDASQDVDAMPAASVGGDCDVGDAVLAVPVPTAAQLQAWARAVGRYVPVGEKLAADVLAAYHQAYSTR